MIAPETDLETAKLKFEDFLALLVSSFLTSGGERRRNDHEGITYGKFQSLRS